LGSQVGTRGYTRLLSAVLGILVLIFVGRGVRDRLPYRPRLYFVDESLGAFKDRVIRSACGDIKLPALGEGEWMRLDLVPRPGCEYAIGRVTLGGDELLRLIELGRRQRSDVKIEVGVDYVRANLTRQ
jgi:hypothetical protein